MSACTSALHVYTVPSTHAGADALGRHRERAAAAVTRHQVVLSAGSSLLARSQRRLR